ncbi:MAG: hypothetical protein H6672_22025 [Anaerolineaceae bacterium]|nr:hypothetical protein [Anaerolineaceae bacterium]
MTVSGGQKRFSLSEDWLATLIGLGIVVVIGFGLLGPGGQTKTIAVQPGEQQVVDLPAGAGWQVAADIPFVPDTTIFTALTAGMVYQYDCQDGSLATTEGIPDALTVEAPPSGMAQLWLSNDCDTAYSLTYKHASLLRWPLFGIFAR